MDQESGEARASPDPRHPIALVDWWMELKSHHHGGDQVDGVAAKTGMRVWGALFDGVTVLNDASGAPVAGRAIYKSGASPDPRGDNLHTPW